MKITHQLPLGQESSFGLWGEPSVITEALLSRGGGRRPGTQVTGDEAGGSRSLRALTCRCG